MADKDTKSTDPDTSTKTPPQVHRHSSESSPNTSAPTDDLSQSPSASPPPESRSDVPLASSSSGFPAHPLPPNNPPPPPRFDNNHSPANHNFAAPPVRRPHALPFRHDTETQEFPQVSQRPPSIPGNQTPTDSVMRWPPPQEQYAPPLPSHPSALQVESRITPVAGETTMVAHLEAQRQALESQRALPYLVVMTGNMTGQIFNIDNERTLLGRSPDCAVSLFDIDISRIHAEIRRNSLGGLVLRDYNSTNGTYVNGKQIMEWDLRDGDRLQLGCSTILKFTFQSELEEMYQRRLYESAVLDGLTQIYNRKFFEERLATEFSFAQRHSSPLSLLMMDIDHFKLVNDTYGHPAGDQALRAVAQSINSQLRKEDIVARYGGEEFAVIARGIRPTQAAILGERIRSSIEHLDVPTASGFHLRVTASIGVATYMNEQFRNHHELLQEADTRLYRAKREGRNQVVAEDD